MAIKYSKPALAKIYRAYISETIAVLRGATSVNEIYIEGDAVWGVFDTPKKSDIDGVFSRAAQISSLIDILNHKLKRYGIEDICVGVGLTYGRSLFIKSGYKNSGINEVVWLGTVVGEAAKLCSYGNRESYDKEIMMSKVFYDNLNEKNKSLVSYSPIHDCYETDAVNVEMNNWLKTRR